MPELPDIAIYIEHLERRVIGKVLESVRLSSPFVLRSVAPPIDAVEGRRVLGLRRLGKRIVFALEDELFLILHLMIAGRLHWKERGAKGPPRNKSSHRGRANGREARREDEDVCGEYDESEQRSIAAVQPAECRGHFVAGPKGRGKSALAALDFEDGTLLLTESSTRKRASLHVVRSEEALRAHDPGGIEVLEAGLDAFRAALTRERHTVKRALTDPRLFSGIGNAYSDEILHRARLSPLQRTDQLDEAEVARLHEATRAVLEEWTARLREEARGDFPEKVTAFRKGMAVHGRYREPCPVCGAPVQRIVHAENESNYCARCQTGGKVLKDRALSRLLKGDWPRSIDELE